MTLREQRHREVTNTLNHTLAQRDACIGRLVRHEARLKLLRKQLARLDRAMAAPPKPAAAPAAVMPPATDEPIPAFLDRRKEADAKDAARRAEIEQANADRKRAQAERSRVKSAIKKEKLMAKLTGATKRMPLTGKAALEHIRARS